jgi:hypothetical protein
MHLYVGSTDDVRPCAAETELATISRSFSSRLAMAVSAQHTPRPTLLCNEALAPPLPSRKLQPASAASLVTSAAPFVFILFLTLHRAVPQPQAFITHLPVLCPPLPSPYPASHILDRNDHVPRTLITALDATTRRITPDHA